MKSRFNVRLVSYQDIHAMPEAWDLSDYRALLEALDFDDVADVVDDEVREMCHMALTDREPEQAAKIVLHHRLGDRLRQGQIDDISNDMLDQPLWEDHSDMAVHEGLYNVNQLLYDAFNGTFPRPRAVRVELAVKALNEEAESILEEPSEAFLARLLAGGLSEQSLLHRLFEDQLAGASFPEAPFILWLWECSKPHDGESKVVVYGSAYWLNELENVESYEAVAYPDAPAPESD